MRIVLFQNSSTQRVSVQQNGSTVLITKDWKKSASDENWITGKGITLPVEHIISLGEILSCKDSEELEHLLSKYTVLKEDACE